MLWLFVLSAVLIGAGLPLQALVNARLGNLTAGPFFASTLSVAVSFAVMIVLLVVQRPVLPPAEQILRLPVWIWVGGVIGGLYVLAATLSVPRLGAAGFIALIVLGQMIGSLVLDHYGVLHAPQSVNFGRILGGILVVAGTLLVLQPWRS